MAMPWVCGVTTCFVKGSASDIVAQKVVEKRDKVNLGRNLGFALFSGAYTGLFQNLLYMHVYTRLFGTASTLAMAARKSLFDAGVHVPLLYMPVGYTMANIFTSDGLNPLAGLNQYKEEFWESNLSAAMVWVPAHLLTFSVVPPHLRIPFTASVSFGWLVMMSSIAGRKREND